MGRDTLPSGVGPRWLPSTYTSAQGSAFRLTDPFGTAIDETVVLPAAILTRRVIRNPSPSLPNSRSWSPEDNISLSTSVLPMSRPASLTLSGMGAVTDSQPAVTMAASGFAGVEEMITDIFSP